ncbi:hypothetical protein K4L44_11875 [Halosquirtibacter laminarini]|uniref:Uncharacterized protein n=1 Tax=Halosquirtibacter laminarini TaxID=3374600 RepID=A0AC61NCP6_9BACT|nr:hypothetical protein K4L44_11875 [Prolixibacteraceae bacterium]
MMNGFTESGITLNFPDTRWFRFQDLDVYKQLSGFNFKEMDACWYDTRQDKLYLIELKDFNDDDIKNKKNATNRIDNLIKKSLDSLQMILSYQQSRPLGAQLLQSNQIKVTQDTTLLFVSILNVLQSQEPDLSFIRERFKSKFRAYEKLFDLKSTVMSYTKAKSNFDFVI